MIFESGHNQSNQTEIRKATVLRGLGILFIVLGHCGGGSPPVVLDWFPIGSFRLALFFFVSGYLFSERHLQAPLGFIKRRSLNYLVRYYRWHLAFGLVMTMLWTLDLTRIGARFNLWDFFINPWINGHGFGLNASSWFLITLFLVQLIYLGLRWGLQKSGGWGDWILTGLFLTGIITMLHLRVDNAETTNTLQWTRVLYGVFFYHLGNLYRRRLEVCDIYFWPTMIAVLVIQFGLVAMNEMDAFAISVVWGNYNSVLVPVVAGCTGIWLMVQFAEVLTKHPAAMQIMRPLGRYSWEIMMLHVSVFWLINMGFYQAELKGFDFDAFYYNAIYAANPFGFHHFNFIYALAGLSLPILFAKYAVHPLQRRFGLWKSYGILIGSLVLLVLWFENQDPWSPEKMVHDREVIVEAANAHASISILRYPESVPAGWHFDVQIEVTNNGAQHWSNHLRTNKEMLAASYHWTLAEDPSVTIWDGLRTNLPTLRSGQTRRLWIRVKAPNHSGTYLWSPDIVQENIRWFGSQNEFPEVSIEILPQSP